MNEPRYTNDLKGSKSPYLLQHAHNPVNWKPWSAKVLEEAKERDLPILVSIGYAACHWCHVMERESFEDEAIADFMNAHFINVKVDREERPDLDDLYMNAVQLIEGSGGWPLNCFLTPEGKPFYGGTYFPPRPMYNRPSWKQILEYIRQIYTEEREKVEKQAERLMKALTSSHERFVRQTRGFEEKSDEFPLEAMRQISSQMDLENGGFGSAPKFPHWMALNLLLKLPETLVDRNFPLNTLDKMLTGGIYDQIGGGICRYATDPKWRVPHFEKMLYDNAQLLETVALAARKTGEARYTYYLEDTLEFAKRELYSQSDGIAASLDADSEGVEGLFYTWTYEEFVEVVGAESYLLELFDLETEGNWEEGRNIIYWKRMPDTIVPEESAGDWWQAYGGSMYRIRSFREKKTRPEKDHKAILSWNALFCWKLSAAIAAGGLGDEKEWCRELLEFIWQRYRHDSRGFRRILVRGDLYGEAQMEDYAYYIRAVLETHRWSQDKDLIRRAELLCREAIDLFGDDGDLYFYDASGKAEDVPSRLIGLYDNTMPSPNAVMAENLYILGRIFQNNAWLERAEKMVAGIWSSCRQHPLTFSYWLELGIQMRGQSREIVIVGPEAFNWLIELQDTLYLPNALYFTNDVGDEQWPLLKGRGHKEDTYIYICENMNCKLPFDNLQEAIEELR